MKPHKHAELIKAWADGAKIQSRRTDVVLASLPLKYPDYEDDMHPTWASNMEYRIKIKTKTEFPKTSMPDDCLMALWDSTVNSKSLPESLRNIVNDVIKYECVKGSLIPANNSDN